MNLLCWFTDEWRMIQDISNIHKSHSPRSFDFYMFHCFSISQHISISVLFYFAGFLKIIASGVGFRAIFLPQGPGFHTFFVTGVGAGNLPFQTNSPWVLPGGDGQV